MNSVINAKEHNARLINDKERLGIKLETLHADVTKYLADETEAAASLEQCEKHFIRDEATSDELTSARAALKKASEKSAEAKRLEELAKSELQKIERDILESRKNIQTRKRLFCVAEQAEISTSLNQDSKIRARLMEAYSAKIISANWSNVTWDGFLAGIFTQPSKEEIDEAIAKFNQKHDLNY